LGILVGELVQAMSLRALGMLMPSRNTCTENYYDIGKPVSLIFSIRQNIVLTIPQLASHHKGLPPSFSQTVAQLIGLDPCCEVGPKLLLETGSDGGQYRQVS
jgi:hypothetical protein